MNRAVINQSPRVNEPSAGAREHMPERPVSMHPNYVTHRGLVLIWRRIAELERKRETLKLSEDSASLTEVERDLRYWIQRGATARVVSPPRDPKEVQFGVNVHLKFDDYTSRCFSLVGEDEADPDEGLINWMSPVAQSLVGCEIGDRIKMQDRLATVIAIRGIAI